MRNAFVTSLSFTLCPALYINIFQPQNPFSGAAQRGWRVLLERKYIHCYCLHSHTKKTHTHTNIQTHTHRHFEQ